MGEEYKVRKTDEVDVRKIKECREALGKYLDKKYSNYKKEQFTPDTLENNIQFLAEYCMYRNMSNCKELLEDYGIKSTYTKYFEDGDDKTFAGKVKSEIENMHKRFHTKEKKYQKAFAECSGIYEYPFANFVNWWTEQIGLDGIRQCYYCEIDEQTVKDAFNQGKISSKKRSFSGNLQIDRKVPPTEESSTEDSDGGYNHDNCVFACVLCNNAKSDMIPADVFKSHFGKTVNAYWKSLIK